MTQVEPEAVRAARKVVEDWENRRKTERFEEAINAHYEILDQLEMLVNSAWRKEVEAADVLIYGSFMEKVRNRIAVLETKMGGQQ